MGIYIKGMKMPTRGFNCPLCEISDAEICCSITIGVAVKYTEIDEQIAIQDKPSWCPLIELPPHGLIDKQMLLRNIAENQFTNSYVGHEDEYAFWDKVWDYIINAPTIIESEGEDD